jgi:hypothetical protein
MSHTEASDGAMDAAFELPKPRKRRQKQPLSPLLGLDPGRMELPEFCAWARVSRTTAFLEIKAGRLKVARIGRRLSRSRTLNPGSPLYWRKPPDERGAGPPGA